MGTVQVTPKKGSYVEEWVALQFDPDEGIVPLKKLLKGTSWNIIEAALMGNFDAFVVLAHGTEFWRVNAGDWIVRSPYDKVWFMGESEFASQFYAEKEE